MSNRRQHAIAGAAAGAGAALFQVRPSAPPFETLLEALGGAGGGFVGSALPDLIEPATSPNHRDVAHSVAASTALTVKTARPFSFYREGLRARADDYAAKRRQSEVPRLEQLWYFLCECFYRLVAGAVSGLVPGYLSHLVLDAGTPKGIPLLAARLI